MTRTTHTRAGEQQGGSKGDSEDIAEGYAVRTGKVRFTKEVGVGVVR